MNLYMQPTGERIGRTIIFFALAALGGYLWTTSAALPFKLLAVMGHETGHALATLAVGGKIQHIIIRPDESGECLSALPAGFFPQVLVLSAGYIGSAIFAGLLLLMAFRFKLRQVVLIVIALWLGLFGGFFAGNWVTFFYCAGMAILFLVTGLFLPAIVSEGLVLFISVFISLYAVFDLQDLWTGATGVRTDAQLLANLTHLPAALWNIGWTVIALFIIWNALRLAIFGRTSAAPPAAPSAAAGSPASSNEAR